MFFNFIFNKNIIWSNVFALTTLHLICLCTVKYALDPAYPLSGLAIMDLLVIFSGLGIVAGSHRLWAHRSYKAKLPLRVVLMIMHTMAWQNDIFDWVRDHRAHHKFSETDADPHNSRRGFFFAHVGWLMMKKHSQVIEKGKTIDLSDVWADPVVRFQRRFYYPLVIVFWAILPTYIMYYFTNGTMVECFLGAVIWRYTIQLHHTWYVNSAAHLFGSQTYDKRLNPRQNSFVTYVTIGEGYHNYHHAFPWDYSASEYGWTRCFNFTTLFIDLCTLVGLAYDRRKPSSEQIKKLVEISGDAIEHNKARPKNFIFIILEYAVGSCIACNISIIALFVRYILNGTF